MALPILANAYDCQVDGIYYNLNKTNKMAEVTYKNSNYNSYDGEMNIPEKFSYEGVEYSVTNIGKWAFFECSGLTSVTIPNTVSFISEHAFSGCRGLTSVTIPNSVITIGWWAFERCSGLTSVTIPNSVDCIESYAFQFCISLTSLTIPASVTRIGRAAFRDCSSLTSIKVDGDNYKYDSRNNCNAIIETSTNTLIAGCMNTIIPNSVTSIGHEAFCGCSGLTSVNIPNSVTSIGNDAFCGCSSLTSVTIPSSVTSIEIGAFSGCSCLTSVISEMENPCNIDKACFSDIVFNKVPLYVPKGTIDNYKSTEFWNKFVLIKETESGSTPDDRKCATPTISYADKRLTLSCETEGVEYHYTITDSDIKSDVSSSIDLSATYEISVYATKSGYTNSDVATATLVWTDAIFTETTPETPTSAKAVQESIPVLISAKGGNISVKCEADGQEVNVYTIDGLSLGTATVKNGEALISTSIPSGDIAVVKVGGRSVKVIMR